MKKRILSLLLTLCMVLPLLPVTALAASTGGIKTVELAVTAPEVGKTPAKDVRVVSPSDVVITSYRWEGSLASPRRARRPACRSSLGSPPAAALSSTSTPSR